MPAVTTFDAGKAVMEITAVQETVNDLLNVRTPEAELFGKTFVVNPDEILSSLRHNDTSPLLSDCVVDRWLFGPLFPLRGRAVAVNRP
jgi:hypothetical protein